MKKLLSILLAAMLLLSLAACGGNDDGDAADKLQGALGGVSEPASFAPTQADGTLLETEFWSVTYPEDWVYSEEDDMGISEGYYAYVTLHIPQEDDPESDTLSVRIDATLEGPASYRDNLYSIGDMRDIVENGTVPTENVGGVDCYMKEGESWGSAYRSWYGRVEGAGATVYVQAEGTVDDPRLGQLLNTLQFNLTDTGNIDPPWPWNGEPILMDGPLSCTVGSYNVTVQQLPIDESIVVRNIFDTGVSMAGDKVYTLTDGVLRRHAFDGSALAFEDEIALDSEEYSTMSVAQNGTLYLSEFMESFVAVRDGATLFSHDGPDYVIMHPSGDWGISYFTGSEVEKIILNGTEMQTEPWAFPEVDMISSISISEDHIFVAGGAVENNEHTIFVYDLSGVLQTKLGGTEFGEDDSLGSVTAVVETANGYMALDGNMRTVLFWAPDGTFIGSAEDSDLFGTSYPWMSSASVMADGSILIGMTEERPDESADEFIVYRLTGF